MGQAEAWQQRRPGPLDDIEPVERRGPHGHQHLTRARLRIGPRDLVQDVDVAVDVVDDGPHDDAARWSRNSSYVYRGMTIIDSGVAVVNHGKPMRPTVAIAVWSIRKSAVQMDSSRVTQTTSATT